MNINKTHQQLIIVLLGQDKPYSLEEITKQANNLGLNFNKQQVKKTLEMLKDNQMITQVGSYYHIIERL
jgi:Fe2+ or Zn2+ uptake regulation protein